MVLTIVRADIPHNFYTIGIIRLEHKTESELRSRSKIHDSEQIDLKISHR